MAELKERLRREAHAIRDEDIAISRSIGQLGFELLRPGDGILTHCNAGTLATAKYGTALAPVYIALEQGWKDLRVFCDETRPLLQGARLTSYELHRAPWSRGRVSSAKTRIWMPRSAARKKGPWAVP